MSIDLLRELDLASKVARGELPCAICDLIADTSLADDVRNGIRFAASVESKIGSRKLAEILSRHELEIGRRLVDRHRAERHLK